MITLPSRASDTLEWDLNSIPDGEILWRFQLGLEDPFFSLDDEMVFESLSLALKKFSKEVFPQFQDRTKGAILYQGTADFASTYMWTEKQCRNWEERGASDTPYHRRIFCADSFSHYFQMLSHSLPDEMPIYLYLDATNLGTLAERHQLLSRARFEHFIVVPQGLPHTSTEASPRALCLPEERMCSERILARLNKKMEEIEKPFRVISEAFLTEDWEGVDILYVLKDTLTVQGERKLKGFEATGGIIEE